MYRNNTAQQYNTCSTCSICQTPVLSVCPLLCYHHYLDRVRLFVTLGLSAVRLGGQYTHVLRPIQRDLTKTNISNTTTLKQQSELSVYTLYTPASLSNEFHAVSLGLSRTTYNCNQFLLFSCNFFLLHLDLLSSLHDLNLHLFTTDLLFLLRSLQLVRQLGFCFLHQNTSTELNRHVRVIHLCKPYAHQH